MERLQQSERSDQVNKVARAISEHYRGSASVECKGVAPGWTGAYQQMVREQTMLKKEAFVRAYPFQEIPHNKIDRDVRRDVEKIVQRAINMRAEQHCLRPAEILTNEEIRMLKQGKENQQ